MIKIRFYWDKRGYLEAEAAEGNKLLEDFFATEIQGRVDLCEDCLEQVEKFSENKQGLGGYGGNITSVEFVNDKAIFTNEFDAESYGSLEIKLYDFKELLIQCLDFLINEQNNLKD